MQTEASALPYLLKALQFTEGLFFAPIWSKNRWTRIADLRSVMNSEQMNKDCRFMKSMVNSQLSIVNSQWLMIFPQFCILKSLPAYRRQVRYSEFPPFCILRSLFFCSEFPLFICSEFPLVLQMPDCNSILLPPFNNCQPPLAWHSSSSSLVLR